MTTGLKACGTAAWPRVGSERWRVFAPPLIPLTLPAGGGRKGSGLGGRDGCPDRLVYKRELDHQRHTSLLASCSNTTLSSHEDSCEYLEDVVTALLLVLEEKSFRYMSN